MDTGLVIATLLIGAVLIIAALAVIYHKLSLAIERLRNDLPKVTGNVIQQIEALMALQAELSLSHPLPQTRGWAASPDFLRTVMQHALDVRPECTVECSSGVSTLVLARCAQVAGRGHVHSLEHDAEFAEKTRRSLRANGLESFATVYDAPLRATTLPGWQGDWYAHDVLPDGLAVDLLVVDGPPWFVGKLPRYPAVPVLHSRLNAASTVFLDDAARPEETETVRRWLADFKDLKRLRLPDCEKGCVGLRREDPTDLLADKP